MQLFQQHRKFASLIYHINSFRRGEIVLLLGDLDPLSSSFDDGGSMVTIDGDSWFGSEDAPTEDTINSLSSDIRLDGEWNIDELDSEEIIFAMEDPQDQF